MHRQPGTGPSSLAFIGEPLECPACRFVVAEFVAEPSERPATADGPVEPLGPVGVIHLVDEVAHVLPAVARADRRHVQPAVLVLPVNGWFLAAGQLGVLR